MQVIKESECPGLGGIATGSNSLPVVDDKISFETLAVFVAGCFSRPWAKRSAESVTPELRYIQDRYPLSYQRIEKDYCFDKEAKARWSINFKYQVWEKWTELVWNFFLEGKEEVELSIIERQLYMEKHIMSVLRLRYQDINEPINFGATVRPHTSDSATRTSGKQFLHWRPCVYPIVSRELYPSSQRIIDTLPGAPGTLLRVGNLPDINVMDMLEIFESRDYNLTSISIPLDPLNQRDVSHGFVTLWDPVDAEHAVIELDGLMVGRYPITVVEMI